MNYINTLIQTMDFDNLFWFNFIEQYYSLEPEVEKDNINNSHSENNNNNDLKN